MTSWKAPAFEAQEDEPDAPTELPFAEMFRRFEAASESSSPSDGNGFERVVLRNVNGGRSKICPFSGNVAVPCSSRALVFDPEAVESDGTGPFPELDAEVKDDFLVVSDLGDCRGVTWLRPLDDGTLVLATGENGRHRVSIHHVAPDLSAVERVRHYGGPGHSDDDDKFYYIQDIERIEIEGRELIAVADGPNDRIKVIDPADGSLFSKAPCAWPWGMASSNTTVYATIGKEIVSFDGMTGATLTTVANDCAAESLTADSYGNVIYSNSAHVKVVTPSGALICQFPISVVGSVCGLHLDPTRGRLVLTSDGNITFLQASVLVKSAKKR